MADIRITNCHIHTFTTAHTPRYFPAWPVVIFRYAPWLVQFLRWLAWFLPWRSLYDQLVRLENFHRTGSRRDQRDVFREVLHYYPEDTRFVVLPLDMAPAGHGPVEKRIAVQHDELAALAAEYPRNVVPFANVHPDTPGAAAEFRRCVEQLNFRGLKLYPKLGFAPDHRLLMDEVYPLCEANGLPVITHCSRGGVWRKGWSQDQRDRVTEPDAYGPVMQRFQKLRICLAHYGGDADWNAYINVGFPPDDPQAKQRNWVWRINEMIRSGDWPNLWVDISYTMFKFEEYAPLLRLFLKDDAVRARVLFGSDFYMTRRERLSEKAVSIRLRDTLGEENFRQIAETNPRIFLSGTAPESAGEEPAPSV